MTSWLPGNLPQRVERAGMMFVPLTPALLDQDYAAVMRDITMLRAWSGQDWPTADFPIESNLADLVRHDREQRDGIALTYSVLLHGVVQGCIYVRPVLEALRTRGLEGAGSLQLVAADVVARGWLHDRAPADLIAASMSWLGAAPFTFPRLWWQASSACPDQLAACDELGLTDVLRFDGPGGTWELRSPPPPS